MSESPLLEVRDLVKHFPVRSGFLGQHRAIVRAVDGVSLSVNEGETLGLVGESGCGKSTLVKAILQLEDVTSGEIRYRDSRLSLVDSHKIRREIQIVFQDPYQSLPPRMRVGDIIGDPLRIHKLGDGHAIDNRVEQLMREVGLNPERADQYPFQFSGGQRQRIGIARALAVHPSLLLLDESVSALDVSVQAQVLNLLKDLQERHHLTYIFISHDLGIVSHMSDRIAVMYLGKVVELGPAAEIMERPLHPYTSALLSAIPSLSRKRSTRIRLLGEPPKPTQPPTGCPFHPRCPIAQQRCKESTPVLTEWRPGRTAACHFAEELFEGRTAMTNAGQVSPMLIPTERKNA